MKKNFLLLLFGVGFMSLTATAQLSTGKTTSNTIRTGNRAEAGDFGLYMGVKTNVFKELTDGSIDLSGTLPLVNMKYMMTDQFELRCGLDLYRSSKRLKGSGIEDDGVNKTPFDFKYKEVTTRNFIYPGVAYHFSRNNLLDVYVGAELPLGYNRYRLLGEDTFDGKSGHDITTRTVYNVGLGGFIGLQAYIANLPIAVGFEYGISGMADLGLKTKYDQKIPGNDAVVSLTPDPSFSTPYGNYEKLSARQGIIGSQLRLTVTYFFKR